MMQHVQSENVRDAGVAKRQPLRVGNRVQPRAPHEVSRENIWRELLKKAWTGSDFERKSFWLTERQQTREKFLLVNAPQDGLLLPNAAVPEKLLVSLRIDSHSTFFIVLASTASSLESLHDGFDGLLILLVFPSDGS